MSLRRVSIAAVAIVVALSAARAADPGEVKIGYVRRSMPIVTISLPEQPAEDAGVAGARMGIDDDNTTGKFLKQKYSLQEVTLKQGDDAVAAVGKLADAGVKLVLVDLGPDDILKVADAGKGKGVLLFNVSATDDRLREEDCRADVIHVAPTRSMLADGLAQYLIWKKWRNWLLAVGSHPKDKLYAAAIKHAAEKFGAQIVEEREFKDTGGARRTDSGLVQIQSQIPLLTQEAPSYDVMVAADESEVFAGYLPFRTWDARPVAGSAGLEPMSWDPTHSQWGAVQLQDRFLRAYHRGMTALDNQAWTAARMIGEAVLRAHSSHPAALLAFFKSPEFALSNYKGVRLSMRAWNQQLRQPILLGDGRTIVSVSPQPGFLHQTSELDTLGYDQSETKCTLK